ncbi:MAG: TolC family protein [Chitinophagales bacterium]|nr:TolC family protein [Chitinophagales bacterium]
MRIHLFIAMLVTLGSGLLSAQSPLKIALLQDESTGNVKAFSEGIIAETEALLSGSRTLSFSTLPTNSENFSDQINEAYTTADVVIGVGLSTCAYLTTLSEYPKPTILSIILDHELQGIPLTEENTSGKENLTYVQAPFDVRRDLAMLYEIIPYRKLALLTTERDYNQLFNFYAFFEKMVPKSGIALEFITVDNPIDNVIDQIEDDVDAVYALPLSDLSSTDLTYLMGQLAEKGLPVFSLFSNPLLELGAYAAYDTDQNFQKIPRRIALNVMKIAEGEPASDLDVQVLNYVEYLMINNRTVKKCNHYPSWNTLSKAILINLTEVEDTGASINLSAAIAEGLQRNLELQIAEKEVTISQKEIGMARSNYLPQVDFSATALGLDENTVRNSFGTRGHINLSAKASLTQLILSEPALANVAIQNLLLESQRQSLRQSELDVIIDIVDAYLGILQATSVVRLRKENVKVTRKNYDISKTKEQVGYGGTSDVYRWESELALDNVDLNNAQAQLRQARFNLNMLLNRSIKEELYLEDVSLADSILLILDERLFDLITNPGDIEFFADFLVQEALNTRPEIKQLEVSMGAQERSLLSQNRAFYLPQVALSAEYDYPIDQFNYPNDVMPISPDPTYNAAIALQLPIFQGNFRRIQKEQTKVSILQLQDQKADLRNKLELQVRSNLETAGASYGNLELSREAVNAARKNFEIAQNSYQQGVLNVTSLIDAQNALLQTEINAINAEYTFISDFLAVERAVGYYHFLALPQERDAYFQRFVQFISNK